MARAAFPRLRKLIHAPETARFISWALISLFAMSGVAYLVPIFTDPAVAPSAATWLIFGIATGMGFGSYKKAGKGDAMTGIQIVMDVMVTWSILIAVIASSGLTLRFRAADAWYLLGAFGIGVFWAATRNHRMANILVNLLIFIGWLPTLHKTITEGNSEPFFAWYISLGAATCAVLLAALPNSKADATDRLLSKIYAWRSFLLISTNLVLMHIYS